jgi:uncharacterized protein with FMN-binding domain
MNRSKFKSIAAIAFTGLSSALVFGFRTTDAPVADTGASMNSTTGSASNGSAASDSGSSTTATPAPASGGSDTAGLYADGTWTGGAVQEPWGTFEVQVVIADGRIANVNLVESPSDRHSTRINEVAVPLLTQAAISTQSAQVDTVSGATWTSESYAASLQSALDAARAA